MEASESFDTPRDLIPHVFGGGSWMAECEHVELVHWAFLSSLLFPVSDRMMDYQPDVLRCRRRNVRNTDKHGRAA